MFDSSRMVTHLADRFHARLPVRAKAFVSKEDFISIANLKLLQTASRYDGRLSGSATWTYTVAQNALKDAVVCYRGKERGLLAPPPMPEKVAVMDPTIDRIDLQERVAIFYRLATDELREFLDVIFRHQCPQDVPSKSLKRARLQEEVKRLRRYVYISAADIIRFAEGRR